MKDPVEFIMVSEDVSKDNIIYQEGLDYCLWRGTEVNPENSFRMFGVDIHECTIDLAIGLIVIEGELENGTFRIFINGGNYRECVKNYIRFLKTHYREDDRIPLDIVDHFDLLEPIPESFNLPAIVLFDTELNLYFAK